MPDKNGHHEGTDQGLPLSGKRVLVTRAQEQAGTLAALLEAQGAIPVAVAAVAIEALADYAALDAAFDRLDDYDWAIFTSVNGVAYFCDRLKQRGHDELWARSRRLGLRICAIGPATARALEERGLVVDYVPGQYIAEAVVAGLKERGVRAAHILLPRALEAREVIATELIAAGATVDEIPVYRTVKASGSEARARKILADREIDVITFTSSSTVRNLIALLGGDTATLAETTIACIGPITAETARDAGLHVDIVSAEHTMQGLVGAMVAFEKERRR